MANTPVSFTLPITPGQKRDTPLEQVLNQIATAFNTAAVPSLVTTLTSPYYLSASDAYLLADASAGAITVFLPLAADIHTPLVVVKTDGSANAVTLTAQAGQLISGAGTLALAAQYDKATVLSDRVSTWYVV